MDKKSDKKVAIVTGGSEGIGKGIATALAKRDFSVYLVARTEEKLERARDEIINQTGNERVEYRRGDVTVFLQIRKIIDEIYDANGRLDVFVNNAGTYLPASLKDNFGSVMEKVISLNKLDFLAPYAISIYLAWKFKGLDNTLKILNVASQAAHFVLDNGIAYGPPKSALIPAMFTLRKEIVNINSEKDGKINVEVYNVYPGTVATEKVIPLIKSGALQNPTTLESLVDTVMDMLDGRTKTQDVYIGYSPGKGIVRRCYSSNPDDYNPLPLLKDGETVVNPNFSPSEYFQVK